MAKKQPTFRIVGEGHGETPKQQPANVKRTLKDVFPLLIHAHRSNSNWLKDLAEDEILITHDLDEILCAYAAAMQDRKGA